VIKTGPLSIPKRARPRSHTPPRPQRSGPHFYSTINCDRCVVEKRFSLINSRWLWSCNMSAVGLAYAERAPISTGVRYVSGSAPLIQRRSMGSECKSLYCLPKYCLCDSSLRTSDTGSPNASHLCPYRSTRTTKPVHPSRVRDRSLSMQELPQPPKSCVSSFKLHAGLITPRRLSLFQYIHVQFAKSDKPISGQAMRYRPVGSGMIP
jgi:hypothetical protein